MSKFEVIAMYPEEVDLILGSNWLEVLGTFILNIKKNWHFPIKKRKLHCRMLQKNQIQKLHHQNI